MLTRLLFPARCVICRKIITTALAETVCPECMEELPILCGSDRHTNGEFFDDCISVFSYKGTMRQSILRYKFSGKRQYARAYAPFIANLVQDEYDGEFDCISWVPVSHRRKLARGYDQAYLLAKAVSAELGTECLGVLKKKRHNRPQSQIKNEAQRRANVLGAYEPAGEIQGKRILLIDDIVTTASTLGEAARTLLTSGAESVLAVTLAKTQKK